MPNSYLTWMAPNETSNTLANSFNSSVFFQLPFTKYVARETEEGSYIDPWVVCCSPQFSFAACCVRSNEPPVSHRPSLADVILHNGWRGDGKVQHFCACHSHAQQRRSARQGVYEGDVSRLYALDGVPTLVLFNPSGKVLTEAFAKGNS